MKIFGYIIFLLMMSNLSYSQRINTSGKKDSAYFTNIKVKIDNFNQFPPGCGIMNFVSVYKATLVRPDLSIGVKDILVFVECREAFGNSFSNDIYYISFKLFKPDFLSANIVNFSGIKIDSMNRYLKAQIYNVRSSIK